MIDIKWNPSKNDLRVFGLLLLPFSGLVAFVLNRQVGAGAYLWVILGLGLLAAIVGIAKPSGLRSVYVAWMIAVFPIGWVVSHLLFGAVFYLVFTPIGIMMRMFGKDPMQRKLEPDRESYWEPISTGGTSSGDNKERHFRQF